MTEELQGLLGSYKQYCTRVIEQLGVVSEKCYQNEQAYVWDAMEDFVDAMDWITKGLTHISKEFDNFSTLNGLFLEQLKNLLSAMENQDMVMMGDLLSYEILPLFEKLSACIDEVMPAVTEA